MLLASGAGAASSVLRSAYPRVATGSNGRGCGGRRGIPQAAKGVRRGVLMTAVGVNMDASDGGSDGTGGGELTVQWMCVNYRPWVKSEEDAVKCLAGQGRRRGFRPLAR